MAHYNTSNKEVLPTGNTQYYNSKWGRVIIYDGTNYSDFEVSCERTLAGVGALAIANGLEPEPAGGTALKDWKERRAIGMRIVIASLDTKTSIRVHQFNIESNLTGLWGELRKLSPAHDNEFVELTKDEFAAATLHKGEAIRAFAGRLEDIRLKIRMTESAITDVDMVTKIRQSLPSDAHWQFAKLRLRREQHTIDTAIRVLESYEQQKAKDDNSGPQTAAMARHSNSGRGDGRRGRNRGRGGNRGRGSGRYRSTEPYSRGNSESRSTRDECLFCGKKGHFVKDCYKAKEAKELLEDSKARNASSLANVAKAVDTEYHSVSYYAAATETAYLGSIQAEWVLDSGASRHFTGNRTDFISPLKRWEQPKPVRTATNSVVDAIGYGTVRIGDLELKEVWLVPDFGDIKLISVRTLVRDGIEVRFDCSGAAIGSRKGCTIFVAEATKDLYVVKTDQSAFSISSENEESPEISTKADQNIESKARLYHRRLGHTNMRNVAKLRSIATGIAFNLPALPAGEEACVSCLAGGMKESYNKTTDSRAVRRAERLHADISGPKAISSRSHKYFLLVVDDYTRVTWIRLLKSKETAEILPQLKEIISMVERETREKVIAIRADNGKGEFGKQFQDELRMRGVRFEPSPPYKHSMNGVVERAMGTIGKLIRSMMFEAKMRVDLWDYAAEHAVWIKNRVPTEALPFGPTLRTTIPLEAYTGRAPDLTKLRVFGCAAYPLNPQEAREKGEIRVKLNHIFVGLQGESLYKLIDYRTLKDARSADVKFNEYVFPTYGTSNTHYNGSGTVDGTYQGAVVGTPQGAVDGTPQRAVSTTLEQPMEVDTQNTGSGTIVGTNQRAVDGTPQSRKVRPDQGDLNTTIGGDTGAIRTLSMEGELEAVPPGDAETEINPGVHVLNDRRTRYIVPGQNTRKTVVPIRTPHSSATRSGRVPVRRIFSDVVARMVDVPISVTRTEPTASINSLPTTPISYQEAIQESRYEWSKAIRSELDSLKRMNTYTVVRSLPTGRGVISSKWVLTYKFKSNGEIARRKARLVVRGFEQRYGVDYYDTFASVVRYSTIRTLLAKACAEDLEIDQLDVETAFLNPTLDEDVYMEIPEHFELTSGVQLPIGEAYLKLNKSLYGLKQAPRAWFTEVDRFLRSLGLQNSTADPNLFVNSEVSILLFVDDMLIIGTAINVAQFKAQIMQQWKCKDMGKAELFIGLQIDRNRKNRTLRLHQQLFVRKLLLRFGMQDSNPIDLPIAAHTVLKLCTVDSELADQQDAELYRQIVGSALYLANGTRIDICYTTGQLSRMMSKPSIEHVRHAKQLLRYLQGAQNLGIIFSGRRDGRSTDYKLFSDATWGTEDDRKAFQGWVVVRYGGAISWSANRQKSTAQSTMEAEIMAASEAAKEAAWMEKLAIDLGERDQDASTTFVPTLYVDNAAAIDLAYDPKFHARAKHIDIRYFYVRNDMVGENRLKVEHIAGAEQPADILTKQLPVIDFRRHLRTLGMEANTRN